MQNVNRDAASRLIYHREGVASADTIDLSETAREALGQRTNAPNNLAETFGAPQMELRLWGDGNDDGTCLVTVVGFPMAPNQPEASDRGKNGPKGCKLMEATFKVGTSTSVNVNPITGDPVSATTFRETQEIVVTVGPPLTAFTGYNLYDEGEDNGQSRMYFDPLGFPLIYVFITAFAGTIGNVHVSLREVG